MNLRRSIKCSDTYKRMILPPRFPFFGETSYRDAGHLMFVIICNLRTIQLHWNVSIKRRNRGITNARMLSLFCPFSNYRNAVSAGIEQFSSVSLFQVSIYASSAHVIRVPRDSTYSFIMGISTDVTYQRNVSTTDGRSYQRSYNWSNQYRQCFKYLHQT